MKVVWKRGGEATVNEILQDWEEPVVPGYTTVLKVLQILEGKRAVKHRRTGKAYTYIAKVSRDESLRHSVKKVVADFFGGNRMALASSLIADSDITREELDVIKKAIADREQEMKDE
jgi:predicted transcriptional regulator